MTNAMLAIPQPREQAAEVFEGKVNNFAMLATPRNQVEIFSRFRLVLSRCGSAGIGVLSLRTLILVGMGNQMVKMKRAPLSAPALRMLRQIADGKQVKPADLFDVSKPRAWDTLHALASRDLVQVKDGIITITRQGRSALRAPAPKQGQKKPAAKSATRPRTQASADNPQRPAPKNSTARRKSTVRFK